MPMLIVVPVPDRVRLQECLNVRPAHPGDRTFLSCFIEVSGRYGGDTSEISLFTDRTAELSMEFRCVKLDGYSRVGGFIQWDGERKQWQIATEPGGRRADRSNVGGVLPGTPGPGHPHGRECGPAPDRQL